MERPSSVYEDKVQKDFITECLLRILDAIQEGNN